MSPALWGGLCALSLGGADFIARFSSRAVGAASALLGMLLVGGAILSVHVLASGAPLVWAGEGLWLLALHGVALTVTTLLLYIALARGPVSIVAPIVASYPAFVLALAVALGARPSLVQWAAIAGTMLGVLVVAASAGHFDTERSATSRRYLTGTIAIAFSAALACSVLFAAGQAAVPTYGELQTLWVGRLVGLATILLLFAAQRRRPALPLRVWPMVAAQGVLDAAGYLFLFAGSTGEGAEIAAVTSSTFGAVTTLLARFILREAVSLRQWLGIALVFVSVAVLSAYR
jgi:drug/metabolite transporter (DMT)-like permease